MTDIEYSEDYAIYLTSHGIEYLTNNVSIDIMNLLHDSAMTVTQISDALEQQKTSVQSNLKKLEGNGLVTSYLDSNDRRRMFYTPVSTTLCVPIKPLDKNIQNNVLKTLLNKNADKYRISLLLAATEFGKAGVYIGPFLERCGAILAAGATDRFRGSDIESALNMIEEDFKQARFPTIKLTSGEDRVQMTFERENGLMQEMFLSINIAIGYVSKIMEEITRIRYICKKGENHFDENGTVLLTPYDGVPSECRICCDLLCEEDIRPNKLAICFVDDHSILFANNVQVMILNMLEHEPVGLKGISECLNIPTVTVHRNLGILERTGAIVRVRDKPNTEFVLRGSMLIANDDIDPWEKDDPDAFKDIPRDPVDYYETIFNHINVGIRHMGFSIDNIQLAMGRSMAEMIIDRYDVKDAMTFLKTTYVVDSILKVNTDVECYLPLTLSITGKTLRYEEFQFIKPFFTGMFSHGLKILTGDDYSIRYLQDDPDSFKTDLNDN